MINRFTSVYIITTLIITASVMQFGATVEGSSFMGMYTFLPSLPCSNLKVLPLI